MLSVCKQCNKEFKPIRGGSGWTIFCSHACYGLSRQKYPLYNSCIFCGISYQKSRVNKFCSYECFWSSRKGFKHSTETLEKMSESMKVAYQEGRKKPAIPMLGKYHSKDTKKRLSEYFTENPSRYWLGRKDYPLKGEKHSRWKGDMGLQPLKERIRKLFEYSSWRKTIFERDDYTCRECNIRGGKLCVDHYPTSFAEILHKNNIKSIEEAIMCNDFWNINNGRTLCFECHKKTPTYLKPFKITSPSIQEYN